MQQLLLVAICDILPKDIRVTITRLYLFFNALCDKVLDFKKLDELEDEAAIILCQLEIYFPPSFFCSSSQRYQILWSNLFKVDVSN